MPFLTEPEPQRGIALPISPGISRIVAANPGPMTYFGTNTYLITAPEGLVLLDPGPDSPDHVAAILAAAAMPIALILLSHTHADHAGALPALRAATGAPVAAWHGSAGISPDIPLRDQQRVAGGVVLHTPGHAGDHLCFAHTAGDGQRVLFSGDHVMSWSSSLINPPDGDMAAYIGGLHGLLARADDLYLPGHGPPLPQPGALVREMLAHRLAREAAIAAALPRCGGISIETLAEIVYTQLAPPLRLAAERNVLAHLLKLQAETRALRSETGWRAA